MIFLPHYTCLKRVEGAVSPNCLLNFLLTLSFCFSLIFLSLKFFRNKRGIDFGRLGGIAIGFWYGRVSLLADGQYLKIMESRQYRIIFLWWIVKD